MSQNFINDQRQDEPKQISKLLALSEAEKAINYNFASVNSLKQNQLKIMVAAGPLFSHWKPHHVIRKISWQKCSLQIRWWWCKASKLVNKKKVTHHIFLGPLPVSFFFNRKDVYCSKFYKSSQARRLIGWCSCCCKTRVLNSVIQNHI